MVFVSRFCGLGYWFSGGFGVFVGFFGFVWLISFFVMFGLGWGCRLGLGESCGFGVVFGEV